MKTKFIFTGINPLSQLPTEKVKEDIFFAMLIKKEQCRSITWVDHVKNLSDIMIDDRFYIALNIVRNKGKKSYYRESLIVSDKDSIISFLVDSVDFNNGYSRPYLITPVFEIIPDYVISITEEASICFSK